MLKDLALHCNYITISNFKCTKFWLFACSDSDFKV